jgi:hypothetical protein
MVVLMVGLDSETGVIRGKKLNAYIETIYEKDKITKEKIETWKVKKTLCTDKDIVVRATDVLDAYGNNILVVGKVLEDYQGEWVSSLEEINTIFSKVKNSLQLEHTSPQLRAYLFYNPGLHGAPFASFSGDAIFFAGIDLPEIHEAAEKELGAWNETESPWDLDNIHFNEFLQKYHLQKLLRKEPISKPLNLVINITTQDSIFGTCMLGIPICKAIEEPEKLCGKTRDEIRSVCNKVEKELKSIGITQKVGLSIEESWW